MPIKVQMPSMSPTMTEGTITKWYKKEGDAVASGDVLAEIETDKATMELEAVEEGRLARILVPAGSEAVPVNKTIAVLIGEGEGEAEVETALAAEPPPQPAKKAAAEKAAAEKPAAEKVAAEKAAPPSAPAKAPPPAAQPPEVQPAPAPTLSPHPRAKGRAIASPLARRIAKATGLDLARVTGSGPGGRIVKMDVEAAVGRGLPAPTPPPRAAVEVPGLPPFIEIPVTAMRRVIAERLTEAKREQPHFYLTIDCEIDALLKIRADLNRRAGGPGGAGATGTGATGPAESGAGATGAGATGAGDEGAGGEGKLSVNDFIVRAVALALDKVPTANVSWAGDVIRQYARADVAVAVAVDGGLITPIIFDAGRKGLAAISAEMRDLGARARAGKLAPHEFQGGTFTISNLGMYGIREFAAVLNPPQACLLAVGKGESRAVVKDGALAVATVMTVTMSIDHRAVDGATGARFLGVFKGLIEDPLTMLL